MVSFIENHLLTKLVWSRRLEHDLDIFLHFYTNRLCHGQPKRTKRFLVTIQPSNIYIHTNSSVREILLHFTHLLSDAIGDDESVDTIVGSGNEGVAAFNDAPDNNSDDVVDEQKNDDDDR